MLPTRGYALSVMMKYESGRPLVRVEKRDEKENAIESCVLPGAFAEKKRNRCLASQSP